MSTFLLLTLGSAIGSIGFRLRGSPIAEWWFNRGIGTGRLIWWATPMTLWALFLGVELFYLPLIFLAFWLGSTPGWFVSLSLGRSTRGNRTKRSWLKDALWMTFRGFLWVAPVALVLLIAEYEYWWILLLGGTLFVVPCYELAIQLWLKGWNPKHIDPENRWISTGEVFYGAMIGLFYTMSLIF